MKKLVIAAVVLLVGVGAFVTFRYLGPGRAQAEFPLGAFPPTLSDIDYHRDAWIKTDCLLCHEKGLQGAPVLKHISVAQIAKTAQCCTCHVLIPESKPRP